MRTYLIPRMLTIIVMRNIGIVSAITIYSGGIGGGSIVTPSDCLIFCSPKKYFFWAESLVHPFIGGQKNTPENNIRRVKYIK